MIWKRRLLIGTAVLAGAGLVSIAGVSASASIGDGPPAVHLAQGELTGSSSDSVEEYLGIPYAKPPVGDLRWRPPVPADPWAGTLDATKPAPDCAQGAGGDSDGSLSENCLYLNVYAPAAAKKDMPVVVFIHGGGYTAGTPNIYDGRRFADTGEAVVVIPAYRLGNFGFFATPGTAAEGEFGAQGNWGILDQQEALRWVADNIAAFGGDPDNVTIVGESAGAGSVCVQLASPTAEGLFDRAVIESLGCGISVAPRPSDVTADWGCAADDMACLRAVPAAEIVGTPASFGANAPIAGGPDLPVPPLQAAADGTLADVPLIVGATRDEWIGFESGAYPLAPEAYEARIRAQFGAAADEVLARYPADAGEDPIFPMGWVSGDSFIVCPAFASAQAFVEAGNSVYFYEFADRTAPGWRSLGDPFPPSTLQLGATHTTELQYLFDYQAAQHGLNREQDKLSAQMVGLWTSFAKTGVPKGTKGTPEWKAFDGERVLELQTKSAGGSQMISTFEQSHNCDFWNNAG